MKLAALALVTTLGLGGIAHADPAAVAPPAPPHGQLQQLLLERFDRDHDGRLDPRERHRAIRALRRLARRLAMHERRFQGADRPDRPDRPDRSDRSDRPDRRNERIRRLVERFDRNGDGVISPDEMPPGMARRPRPLDRNGDGSLDGRDQ
jgi:hypothetical protein